LNSHRFPKHCSWRIVILNISFSMFETLFAEVFYYWINGSSLLLMDLVFSTVLFGLWFAKHYCSNTIPTLFQEK
jgi:hypothetical protein